MSTPTKSPLNISNLTHEEMSDIQQMVEEFGTHIDLNRVNEAFMAHESSLSDADYRGLLAVNLFYLIGQARRAPNLIDSRDKEWIFQTMGYLGMDPRKVLRDESLTFLSK